jgi:hypothetical protein
MTKICLIAGSKGEAVRWAFTQHLEDDQWFYAKSEAELLFRSNFHVIVIGDSIRDYPWFRFEKIYQLALERGKIGRM